MDSSVLFFSFFAQDFSQTSISWKKEREKKKSTIEVVFISVPIAL